MSTAPAGPGERTTTAETAMNDNRLVDTGLIDQA